MLVVDQEDQHHQQWLYDVQIDQIMDEWIYLRIEKLVLLLNELYLESVEVVYLSK